MNDQEAYEYYLDPEHLKPAGPGRKPERPALTSMVPVRFPPEAIEAVKAVAHDEGITVSAWIRRLVQRELGTPARPAGLIPGSGRTGEPKALTSSLSIGAPRTFACPHLGISGVQGAACFTCGPLRAAA
jgi:hypothetical protein